MLVGPGSQISNAGRQTRARVAEARDIGQKPAASVRNIQLQVRLQLASTWRQIEGFDLLWVGKAKNGACGCVQHLSALRTLRAWLDGPRARERQRNLRLARPDVDAARDVGRDLPFSEFDDLGRRPFGAIGRVEYASGCTDPGHRNGFDSNRNLRPRQKIAAYGAVRGHAPGTAGRAIDPRAGQCPVVPGKDDPMRGLHARVVRELGRGHDDVDRVRPIRAPADRPRCRVRVPQQRYDHDDVGLEAIRLAPLDTDRATQRLTAIAGRRWVEVKGLTVGLEPKAGRRCIAASRQTCGLAPFEPILRQTVRVVGALGVDERRQFPGFDRRRGLRGGRRRHQQKGHPRSHQGPPGLTGQEPVFTISRFSSSRMHRSVAVSAKPLGQADWV